MAINLGLKYPTQTGPVNAAWPQGSPQNVTSPLDGTGTPFNADGLGADLCALMQRAMAAASITPNQNPDTGANSQIYDALMRAANPLGFISARVSYGSTITYVDDSIPSIDGYEIVPGSGETDQSGEPYARFGFNIDPASLPGSGGLKFRVIALVNQNSDNTSGFANRSTPSRIETVNMISPGAFEQSKAWFEVQKMYVGTSGLDGSATPPQATTASGLGISVFIIYERTPGVTLPVVL